LAVSLQGEVALLDQFVDACFVLNAALESVPDDEMLIDGELAP
jgi:hypothetical protein